MSRAAEMGKRLARIREGFGRTRHLCTDDAAWLFALAQRRIDDQDREEREAESRKSLTIEQVMERR